MILTGSKNILNKIKTGLFGDKLVEIYGQGIKENDLIITGIKKGGENKSKTPPWQSKTGR